MTELELLADLIDDLEHDLYGEIEPLSTEHLSWNPGFQANSIGTTLWHIARGLDFLAVRVLQGKNSEQELWHTLGWQAKTAYDPRGHGYDGWGVLTGYSWEEVLQVPKLQVNDYLEYLRQSCQASSSLLRKMSLEVAYQPVPGFLIWKAYLHRMGKSVLQRVSSSCRRDNGD